MPPRQRRRVPPPTAQSFQVPAPTGGINSVAAGLALPPGDCVQAFNVVADANGCRVRLGNREHCTGLTGDGDNTVRSLLPFLGASSKLFSATSTGICDTSESSEAPTEVVSFSSSAGDAGWGVSTVVQVAGGRYLFYADEENGLYRWAETGDTWVQVAMGSGPGEIDGVDPADVCFVTLFKGRVWMVEKDTTSAWYLPLGQVAGTALEFPMGLSFKHGGSLVGLWSWSYDGGSGVDDSLVARSSGGDVLVWQGTDPSSADTWGLRGVWYSGPPPAGRRVCSDFGGDLLLLTYQGVVPMSRLVVGLPDVRAEALTSKVTNLLNVLMSQRGNFQGWSLVQHPEDSTLVVTVPQGSGDSLLQLVQSAGSKGWFIHRDLPMCCAVAHDKQLYFGTPTGTVNVNTGYVDGLTLEDPESFIAVQWAILTAASDLGTPRQKQLQLIRPLLISEGTQPAFAVEARYRFSQEELDPVTLQASSGSTWDGDTWDSATWGGDLTPSQEVRGATGMGTACAIAIRGASIAKTVLLGIDVSFTVGGFL